jgi:hypothetical protein
MIAFTYGASVGVLQYTLYGVAGKKPVLTSAFSLAIGISSLMVNLFRILMLVFIPNKVTSSVIFFSCTTLFLGYATLCSYRFVELYNRFEVRENSQDIGCSTLDSLKEYLFELKLVYSKNYVEALSILLTFVIEYTFYPGAILKYKLSWFRPEDYSWFVIFVVTFHSLSDTLGRYLGAMEFSRKLITKKVFPWMCLARLVFVYFYLLSFNGVRPEIFGADWFIVTNLFLFSISCGYLTNIGMRYGSDSTTINRGVAGSLMGFHLIFGICMGSSLALIFLSAKK